MPRYFFHTQTDTRLSDDTGVELIDHKAARVEAIKACAELTREYPETFWGSRPWSVTVTQDDGLVLYEIQVDGTAAPAAGAG